MQYNLNQRLLLLRDCTVITGVPHVNNTAHKILRPLR